MSAGLKLLVSWSENAVDSISLQRDGTMLIRLPRRSTRRLSRDLSENQGEAGDSWTPEIPAHTVTPHELKPPYSAFKRNTGNTFRRPEVRLIPNTEAKIYCIRC